MTGEHREATRGSWHGDIPDERCDSLLLVTERRPNRPPRVVDESPCALMPLHVGDHVSPDGRERWPQEDDRWESEDGDDE